MTHTRPPARSKPRPPAQHANRLLAALGEEEYEGVSSHLSTVDLKTKDPLIEPNQTIQFVYFPIDLVTSILAETEAGVIEVGTVGNEGMVGLPVYLGAASYPGRALVQIEGRAEQMEANAFRQAVGRGGRLRELLQRYTLGFMTQVSQGTACNRAHSVEQRLARWLLIVRDRVGRDEFPLTQEFMGQMLGVRRATVSEAAGVLQERGLIRYTRGMLCIRSRSRLERVACECYRIVRDEFERLLGVPMG